MPYLSFAELLNPQASRPSLENLQWPLSQTPPRTSSTPALTTPPASTPPAASTTTAPTPEVKHNIYLNRKTTLSVLKIFHDATAHIEYPTTHASQPVGYLFRQDVDDWQNPMRDFAYSLGRPSGRTKPGDEVYCDLMTDKDRPWVKVPCSK
jgi:hypothetical protein